DVLGDGGLAEALRGDENHISGALEKLEAQGGFDGVTVDLFRPVPVEVGHWLETANLGSREAALNGAACAIGGLFLGDVLEELGRTEALLGGQRDNVIE